VTTWEGLERDAPELATAGLSLWRRYGMMYLATVRADGSPRVHPVSPVLTEGRVFVAIPETSPKLRDLRRDPRSVLHCLPGERDEEFAMRCEARDGSGFRLQIEQAAAHTIRPSDQLLEFDIQRVHHGWWENVGQPDTYPVRRRWPA
jgi:hypothetical protein